ncbi:peroxisomal trans-2-enoyl-CoA reductase isoform X2 [Stegostoma tigrinum]|uniref:peroxisomal trans-2-enoyl-CoA reductase isoform X2 n=1 Tax=Stegostoma tigrinum TaxID=3053191 RepID=UPI00202AC2D6|nr:peroxisomal trans-2-enoyl-CoA reductase isoform X2 [Stegostoma tigrinum]
MAVRSVFRAALFRDRVVVVTGGGTGIGTAIAAELLGLECNVVIASRKIERLRETAEQLSASILPSNSAKITAIQCNIRKEDEVRNLMKETLQLHGRIDYLANNAGGQFPSPTEHITAKGWNAVIETNLTGTFYCCREVYAAWMKENGGTIVNIVADMWKGFPGMSHTGAARAAVDNLTKSLAIEWAASGVRVNAVAPNTTAGRLLLKAGTPPFWLISSLKNFLQNCEQSQDRLLDAPSPSIANCSVEICAISIGLCETDL